MIYDHREHFRKVMESKYVVPHINPVKNCVIDSWFPIELAWIYRNPDSTFYDYDPDETRAFWAISPVVAKVYGCRKLDISDLVKILGYSKTEITNILRMVRKKEYRIILAGMGGTGSNFVYWLEELVRWTRIWDPFHALMAMDDDRFDMSNIPRIPFDLSAMKVGETTIGAPVERRPEKTIVVTETPHVARTIRMRNFRLTEKGLETLNVDGRIVVYGAPDLETRQWLSEARQYPFFAGTHGGNRYYLLQNPRQNTDIQIETYGKINLAVFFMNQLKMTIEFLRKLADMEWTESEMTKEEVVSEENLIPTLNKRQWGNLTANFYV